MTKSKKGEDKKKGDMQIFNKKAAYLFFSLDGRRQEVLCLVLKEFASLVSLADDNGTGQTDQITEKTR